MCRMHFGMPDTNLISLQPSDDDDVYEGVTVDFAAAAAADDDDDDDGGVYEGVTVDDVLLIVQLRCISRSQPTSQTGGR